jgi:mono/diheme cytochrome c family protein
VATVVFGMVYLGIKSQIDDRQAAVAQQLVRQLEEEKAYSAKPFEPYTDSPEASSSRTAVGEAVDPLVSKGRAIFNDRGCSACHGVGGIGTDLAPSLVGITKKLPQDRLVALLHNPSLRMKAGGMPTVDATPDEMAALIAYLGTIGTRAENSPAVANTSSRVQSADAGGVNHPVSR